MHSTVQCIIGTPLLLPLWLPRHLTHHIAAVFRACSAITDNTRASYPIEYIDNARLPCVGPHARNVVLLCCDAFGVLPPVSRLNLDQAMYHFISGYTSKVGEGRSPWGWERVVVLVENGKQGVLGCFSGWGPRGGGGKAGAGHD
jgi:hypothetical protein